MTSELLSKLIASQINLSSTPPYQNDNFENQSNLNEDNCIPAKESQKYIPPEYLPISLKNNNFSLVSPSFSHYINPHRLTPYDDMLIKNIRTFNILENNEKNNEKKDEKSLKDKSFIPIIEINFKFTCDYESIENEIKEFFELFGEIHSLDYNMNANSAKINYKYAFSAMYANYYLNHLLNEKNKKDNNLLNKEKNENKNIINVAHNIMKTPEEKQNEEIIKFIKFLTDNYKNESKNKNGENENESNAEKEKSKEKCGFSIEKDNKNNEKYNSEIKYSSSLNKNSIINTEKKCYSNNNNSSKYLILQQNSETPIKKTNTINNYSANNINQNQNQNSNKKNENENVSQENNIYSMPTAINQSFSTPMIYVPFVPKMNMGIPISIPVLFPMNSPFLNKSFYLNEKNGKNENCDCEKCKNCKNYENNSKIENNINSCLMNIKNDNPININNDDNIEKYEKNNSQNQNDNHIKEIFENLNNKIAIISNISNNSTNSNEKNMKKVENNNENNDSSHKTNSELDSNNNILNSKSDSTIKTEEVNKSSNTSSNNNSNENKKDKDQNINNNSNSSDKNSLNMDMISSFKGKTVSLEKLNNYLENNKPMSSFANPKLSLSSEKKNNSPKKIDISNFNKNTFNNNIINNKDNNISNINKNNISINIPKNNIENKKNIFFPPMNNYFNSMYNFLFLPNLIPNPKMIEIMQKIKSQLPNPNNYNFKQNPIYFNKNVIDFNKLTLETKNRVHFTTHSSRDYYYKYVCNYIVQIENDNFFMVTKRIIGKNGCFLKKILQESCIKYGDFSTKIRLRGKGSGYIDKISKSESDDEPLTLSVSSLNYPTYYNCCLLIDNLMNKIYDDYFKHLHNVLPKELHYSIHKKQLLKNEFIVDRVNSINSMNSNSDNNNKIDNKNMNDKQEDKKSENIECDDKGKCE